MSLYLQRLLDRAAIVSAEAMVLRPLVTSGSPVVAFDQRLGDPEIAADFSLVGAPPEAPELGTEPVERGRETGEIDAATDAPEPPRRRLRRREAPEPQQADERKRASLLPESTKPPRALRRVAPSAPEAPLRAKEEPPKAAPPPPAEPRAPLSSAPLPAPAEVGPAKAAEFQAGDTRPGVVPAPLAPPPSIAAEPVLRAPEPCPERRELRPQPPAASEPKRGAGEPAAPAEPAPGAPPPPPAAPAAVAEPLARSPEPLPPPPRPLDRTDVAKMIETALAAERRAAPATAPPPTTSAAAPAAERAGDKPALRPGTAAEASVIGRLESSRFRPMLFGVRRR